MHILITGGTGFIGSHLCQRWRNKHQITVLSRQSETKVKEICGDHVIAINDLQSILPSTHYDAVVNLAGAPIADARWSEQRKEELTSSRIAITRALTELVARLVTKPDTFISGSAVGFYGDQGSKEVTEATPPHQEFTHELCAEWEATAAKVEHQTRVCYLRTGLVMGADGGFLSRMTLPFKLGLGARLGNGRQFMPWIHLEDMLRIIDFLLENKSVRGPFNACAPRPVINRRFTQTLAETFNRPAFLVTPAPILKLALGEMSRLLLTGQNAKPQKLLDAGFEFRFTELKPALHDLFVSDSH